MQKIKLQQSPEKSIGILDRVPLLRVRGFLTAAPKLRTARDLIFGVLVGLLLGLSSYFVAESDVEALTRPAEVNRGFSNSTLSIRCVVIIQPHTNRAEKYVEAVRDTFAKQCNQTLYFTTSKTMQEKFREDLKIYLIDTHRTFAYWSIFHHAVDFASQREKGEFEWNIVVNEQSYVVMDNLRDYLHSLDHRMPTIVGKVVDKRSLWTLLFPFYQTEAFDFDAGVLFSSSALEIVASKCVPGWFEPRYSAKMLRKCASVEGIDVYDPFDEEGLRLFHAQSPLTLLSDAGKPRDFSMSYSKQKTKLHCCSDSAITFGAVNYKDQRMMAYALNSAKVYGLNRVN